MEKQIVVFDLNHEHYGVEISSVEGIIKLPEITSVPGAPKYVEGVTNLRGKVLPIVDLRRRFGLPARSDTAETRIVVVQMGRHIVGMIVDAVSEVLYLDDSLVEPPSTLTATTESAMVNGIARLEGRLIILLDLDQILVEQAPVAA
ncbi:MAG TPA: chemotaxis protein CheW [Anaerolineales bacterium]|nr:chemotaxis protein CheW [Anaerolineales bacterium]